MKINLVADYGLHASSLTLITQKIFLELGKLMNKQKSFTVAATMYSGAGIGDVNQHYDCISIPNMGGYNFPPKPTTSSKNLFIGIVGIDEVVLGRKVFRTDKDWKRYKPIIQTEVKKWKKHVKKINRIHTSTISDKQQIIDYLKVPEEQIDVIPYGVDHDLFKPAEDKSIARKKVCSKFYIKNTPYFVHISESNWARKNTIRLFEAFKKARSAGIPHNLIVIGRNHQLIHKKAQQIPGIIMCGYVKEKDMIGIIQGADALLLPSIHEGFGLPLVEAMSCGVPSITSDVFSPPEIMKDAGLFADPYSVSDISEKIIKFAKNKKLQEELSKYALKRSQYFSWAKTAEKLLKLFQKNTENELDSDFDADYDSAAYRTLVTVCQIHPHLKNQTRQDLLEMNYTKIINWAVTVGLHDGYVKDYLTPLTKWLEERYK